MKLDTSGLESTAPLFGSSSSELLDEISAAPSFALPNTINVSSNVVLLFSLISYSHERKVEVLLAEYWLLFFSCFSLMDSRKRLYRWWSQQREPPRLHSYSKRVSWLLLILELAWEAISVCYFFFLSCI